MKTQMIRNVSLGLLAAASVFAQNPHKCNVNVPFGFHVGDTMLPAGRYALDTDIAPNVVRVKSDDMGKSILILTHGVGRNSGETQSRLIFNRYGDQYFLSQVWTPAGEAGRELRKTKRETQEAANRRPTVESVLAAK
jgi:hypothetical protein